MADKTRVTVGYSDFVINILRRIAYLRGQQLKDNRYGIGNANDDLVAFIGHKHPEILKEFLGEAIDEQPELPAPFYNEKGVLIEHTWATLSKEQIQNARNRARQRRPVQTARTGTSG